jgi:hypothetical protein
MKEKEIDYSWRDRNIKIMYVTQKKKGSRKKKYVPRNLKWKKLERNCEWNLRDTQNIELAGRMLRRMMLVTQYTMKE